MTVSSRPTAANSAAPLKSTTVGERDDGSPLAEQHTEPSAFRLCGYAGILLASVLANALGIYRGLSPGVMLTITAAAIMIFFALAMATKIAVSEERLVYYHHEIAVVSGVALFLRCLHQPVLPYLDMTMLGLGVFLACGRIGCLLVGCCHGRPCRWGVRYSREHAAAGFTPYYVGISLFPVQALESLWTLCIVAAGAAMMARGSVPGSVFALYVVLYGLGRFCFEFLRGDPDRPYFFGFSEAQWTSVILMSLTVLSEAVHKLPFQAWHWAITTLIVLGMAAVAVGRRFQRTPAHRLLHPSHIREIAEAITFATGERPERTDAVPQQGSEIRLGCTSLGVRISAGQVRAGGAVRNQYAVSQDDGTMNADCAYKVAKAISLLRHSSADFELVRGNMGVFHILIPATSRTQSRAALKSRARFSIGSTQE